MKRIFVLICGIVWAVLLTGAERTETEAAQVAENFLLCRRGISAPVRGDRSDSPAVTLAHKQMQNDGKQAALYVFNKGNGGFVIVSADDRAETILGYSENGSFDAEKMNPALRWWLHRYADQLSSLTDESPAVVATDPVTPIPNMLVTADGIPVAWEQYAPYNNKCPKDLLYPEERALAGCVAAAAAQVLYKWRYPQSGVGTHSYTYWEGRLSKTLSLDFSSLTFDWDNMLPTYKGTTATATQQDAVATLVYAVGVASEMVYGGSSYGGSGTYTDYLTAGLVRNFGYKYTKFVSMAAPYEEGVYPGVIAEFNVTREQMKTYLNTELEAGRPVIMGGEDSHSITGHEFVCCGRDADNKFYMNWGWEGKDNGYYALDAFNPSGAELHYGLDAILGLEPNPTTALPKTEMFCPTARKYIRNGRLYIWSGDRHYSIIGLSIQ